MAIMLLNCFFYLSANLTENTITMVTIATVM